MSLTADLTENNQHVIGGSVDPSQLEKEQALEPEHDVVDVACGACGATQQASGRALGFTCHTCGETWRVLKCRECRKASLVLDGVTACPRCGHAHQSRDNASDSRMPTWLIEPVPLSIWLGSVKYLGGHVQRAEPVGAAGLLFDRRGIHLRAFAELFSIEWESVRGVAIEGPQDISDRLTTSRLLALGASTWALQVAYLTVRTANGDAIFEVDGLGPPELHARLSRVIQGLQRSERLHAPVPIDRTAAAKPRPSDWVEAPPAPPAPSAAPAPPKAPPASPAPPKPLAIDLRGGDTPMEVLVVDALWKLAQLREAGLLDQTEVLALRTRLLAQLPDLTDPDAVGPLLHV